MKLKNITNKAFFIILISVICSSFISCSDNIPDTTGTGIIIGEEGWLFDENSIEYKNYIEQKLFSDEELEKILSVIKNKRSFFAKTNTDLIMVIIPDRMNIYSSKLPSDIKNKKGTENRITQVYNYIKKNTRVTMVDMTELYTMNSAAFDLYQRTGANISEMGAYLAYTEIVKAVNTLNIASLNLAAFDKFNISIADDEGLEYASLINSVSKFKNKTISLTYKDEIPYEKQNTSESNISVTTISEDKRNKDYRYTNLILYGTEKNIDAINKFTSLTFKSIVYSTGFNTDASVTLEYKPNQAVFLISESELDLLLTSESQNMDMFETKNENNDNPASVEPVKNEDDPIPESLELIPPDENTLATPIVTGKRFSDNERLAVAGVTEAGSTLYITGSSDDSYTYYCENGIFLLDIYCKSDVQEIIITAKTEGKKDSSPITVTIKSNMRRGNKGAFVGLSGHIHINETANDYLAVNTYSETAAKNMRNRFERILKNIQEVSPNTKLIIMVAPNHSTIYPETMPNWLSAYKTEGAKSKLEMLYTAMEDSEVIFPNLTKMLLEKKDEADFIIYNKTDTHWNELGAYYVYEHLMNEYIASDFPEAKAIGLSEFDVFEKSVPGGDMLNFLGFNLDLCREIGVFVRPKTFNFITNYDKPYRMNFENIWTSETHIFKIDNDNLPSMMMFRDSFSSNLINFMAQNFKTSYFNGMWSYGIDMNYLEKNQPDYVIFEGVERNIDSIGS